MINRTLKSILITLGLGIALAGRARADLCTSCIINTPAPQNATFNLMQGATIQGVLSVGVIDVGTLNVSGTFSAGSFAGGGSGLTGLNASALASGTVPPSRVAGNYLAISGVGTIGQGIWQGTPVATQYGGTGQDFSFVSAGSMIYFDSAGHMNTFLQGPDPQMLLQTGTPGVTPVWTSSPAVSGVNLYNIPAARLTGTLSPTIIVSSTSITYVNAAAVVGDIPGNAQNINGTLLQSQIATGTWSSSYPASSVTATGVAPGVYGNPSTVPQFSVHSDGRVYAASNLAIAITPSQISAGALPGGVTVPTANIDDGTLNPGVIAQTLIPSGVVPQACGGPTVSCALRVNSEGLITSATAYAIPSVSTFSANVNVTNVWTAPQISNSSWTINSNELVTGTLTVGFVNGNGSGLTNLTPGNISAGALPVNVTLTTANFSGGFNAPNELVQLNGSGALPALNAAALFNLTAPNLVGAVPAGSVDFSTITAAIAAAGGGVGGGGWVTSGSVVSLTTATNNVVIQSTLTVQGSAFSVGVSTLIVSNGIVQTGQLFSQATILDAVKPVLYSYGEGIFQSTSSSVLTEVLEVIDHQGNDILDIHQGALAGQGNVCVDCTSAAGTTGAQFEVADSTFIVKNGMIGVGVLNPIYGVDVHVASPNVAHFLNTLSSNGGILLDATAGFNANFEFQNGGSTEWYFQNNASLGNAFIIFDSAAATFPFVILQSNDFVGMQTSAPSAPLDVENQNSGGYSVKGSSGADFRNGCILLQGGQVCGPSSGGGGGGGGGGGTGASWTKYTKTFSDFAAASTSNSITLFSASSQTIIMGVAIKQSTSFSGGSITDYTVSVGTANANALYASPFDTFQAVGNRAFQTSQNFSSENFGTSWNVTATAVATGDNLNNATAGSVDIWVETQTLP